ncbi:myosin heavy chain 95F-like [Contarinia nasturtii]|uniref:myosin heavy chain 95F-like n=1 Tax=Contarinia nasturtii TaxID=265458 RepID=UPI0012D41633|nr:myosin heavy chain 95F-like [Contarinia nasturtii]
MNNQNDLSFMKDLKDKFFRNEIYSYISDVLIAVNPYKTIHELYTVDAINMFKDKDVSNEILPAHLFVIANEVKKNKSTPQSIIVSGESGSGKTETSKCLLKFFSGSEQTQEMINANILLESFGNSRTTENENSSRFIKTIQLKLDSLSIASIKLCTFSLESSRVCPGTFDTFHIFYYLAYGATSEWKKKLNLEHCSFPILTRHDTNQNLRNFETIDGTLYKLGVSENEKKNIYVNLSVILHLSNVKFEEFETGARITEFSKKNVIIAANLMNIAVQDLEEAILFRSTKFPDSIIITRLNVFAASRARDTISKAIYDDLFKSIVFYINRAFENNHQSDQSPNINILDIAGFECFNSLGNRFEQFCINYSNEKIQNFCTQRLICDEINWYKEESINVPEISFPGNDMVLDMLENKKFGIFSLLDEECRMPNPQTESFIQKENFIEHNAEVHSKYLCNLLVKILKPAASAPQHMYKFSNAVNDKKKTYSGTFIMELESLISELKPTRPYFIRCVKPNRKTMPDIFDDTIVFNQLQSSGMLAYNQLIQLGFPIKIMILDLFEKLKSDVIKPKESQPKSTNMQYVRPNRNNL